MVITLGQRCTLPSAAWLQHASRRQFRIVVRCKRPGCNTSLLKQSIFSIDIESYPLDLFAGEAVPTATPSGASQGSLRLRFGSACIPHPDKAHYGGEDAHFLSPIGGGAAGVADGVGGWQESGVNPAEYSATLMECAKAYLEGRIDEKSTVAPSETPSTTGEWMDPSPGRSPISSADQAPDQPSTDPETSAASITAQGALRQAHRLTRKPGSSTACVLRLDASAGELDVANLGDSGLLIIRNGQVAFKSPPLQHFFDCPYQFGAAPEFLEDTDTADDAAVYRLAVLPGDAIVLATDGVLDNIWPAEIAKMAPRSAEEVQSAADAISALAAERGADSEFDSPYAAEAMDQGVELPIWEKLSKISFEGGKLELGKIRGGKLDDVTVVVGFVEGTAPPDGGSAAHVAQDY